MMAKTLIERLTGLPEHAHVVVPAPDHSYREVSRLTLTTALFDSKTGIWFEDHGEEATPEADYGRRVEVVVIE